MEISDTYATDEEDNCEAEKKWEKTNQSLNQNKQLIFFFLK